MMSGHVLDDSPLTGFHRRLTLAASGGPFLDGYTLSMIGATLAPAARDLGMTTAQEGLIGAASLVGIFLGAFLGGRLSDRFGRKTLFTVNLAAVTVIAVAQFFAPNALSLIVLRLLIGIVIGADYPIATALVAEFAPRRYRGSLLGAVSTMWFVGALAAYVVAAVLMHFYIGWRWMLASAALPGAAAVLLRVGTPESPRWLLGMGRFAEAHDAAIRAFGHGVSLSQFDQNGNHTSGPATVRSAAYAKRMLFVTVFWTCSVVPVFAVYAFGPKILAALGLAGDMMIVGSAAITTAFLVGSLLALALINRMGRRTLIIHSFLWSGSALLLVGLVPNGPVPVVLALLMTYATLIGGTQLLQWIYPNELFPTEIRGSAVGLASSLSRVDAAGGTYPIALAGIGIGPTMLAAAAITLLGAAVSVVLVPETRGKSLQESAAVG